MQPAQTAQWSAEVTPDKAARVKHSSLRDDLELARLLQSQECAYIMVQSGLAYDEQQ